MIKTIIVDDDVFHLDSLVKMIKNHFKHIDIIATSSSVQDAVKKIDTLNPQLVFLDIELGSLTAFDLLEMLGDHDFEVIFTTCFSKYAIQALRASALDFIEKPLQLVEVLNALNRYKEKTSREKLMNLRANFRLPHEEQKIALNDKNGSSFYKTNNIIRCQSCNSYTEFYIIEEGIKPIQILKIVVSKGFEAYEDFLIERGFFYRVHNQHIINVNHIKNYFKDDGGYLLMDDHSKEAIPIARARKEDFIGFLRHKGMMF